MGAVDLPLRGDRSLQDTAVEDASSVKQEEELQRTHLYKQGVPPLFSPFFIFSIFRDSAAPSDLSQAS